MKLATNDFVEMEQALSAWDQRYEQVSPGGFHGSVDLVEDETLGVMRLKWGRGIHYQGVPPQGTVALGVTFEQVGHGRWVGQEVHSDSLLMQPKGAEAEYFSAPMWDSLVVTVCETELLERVARFTEADPEAAVLRPCAAGLRAEVTTRVARLGLDYIRAADRHLDDGDPSLDDVSPEVSRDLLLDEIGFALACAHPVPSARPSLDRQRSLVRSAFEYACRHGSPPIRFGELCRDLHVSPRTLRYAFRSVTGIAPAGALKAKRLNEAYRDLRRAEPSTTLVKQVALDCGFSHQGYFSQDYRALFGESPSETLQRPVAP